MNITNIVILKGFGADKVILHTNLPSSMPNLTQETCALDFQVEKDKAEEYVEKHFPGIPITIIENNRPSFEFRRH
jgi:hypothetical protein